MDAVGFLSDNNKLKKPLHDYASKGWENFFFCVYFDARSCAVVCRGTDIVNDFFALIFLNYNNKESLM